MAKTETMSPISVSRSWLPPMDGGTALMGFAKELRQDRCPIRIPLDLQRFTRY